METFIKVNANRNLVITKDSKDGRILYTLHDIRNNRSEIILDSESYEIYLPDAASKANDVASQNLFIHLEKTDWQILFDLLDDALKIEESRMESFNKYKSSAILKKNRTEAHDMIVKEITFYKQCIKDKHNFYLSSQNSHENEFDYDNLHLTMKKPSN